MRFLAAIGALAIVVGIGCAVFFFGGFTASPGRPKILPPSHGL